MIPLHRATVGAVYQHLERLAALDGETTAGAREWAKQRQDKILLDDRWWPSLQLNGGWSAERHGREERQPNAKQTIYRELDGHWRGGEFVLISWASERECSARCDVLNAQAKAA